MKRILWLSSLLVLLLISGGCENDSGNQWDDLVESAAGAGTVAATQSVSVSQTTTEKGKYWGRHNGNRPHWYYSKKMSDYPSQITVTIEGCTSGMVVNHNGNRWESGGYLVKQSDVSGRGMVILGPSSCFSRVSHIKY